MVEASRIGHSNAESGCSVPTAAATIESMLFDADSLMDSPHYSDGLATASGRSRPRMMRLEGLDPRLLSRECSLCIPRKLTD